MTPRRGQARVVRLVEGVRGTGRHAHGAGAAVRLRGRRALAPADPPRACARSRVPTPSSCGRACRSRSRAGSWRPTSRSSRDSGSRSRWSGTPRTRRPPPQIDPWDAAKGTTRFWREWAGRCTYDGRVARRRAALADHAEGADVPPDRRDRRRRHDVDPRADRRRPELGLPVLLAPRRDVHALRPADGRLRARGGGLARVAAARGRRRPARPADHVRDRGRAAHARDGARLAPGLRGVAAGPGGQRRRAAVPAGRLRRGPRPAPPGGPRGPARTRRRRGRWSCG